MGDGKSGWRATEGDMGEPRDCSAANPGTAAERPRCDTANKVCVPCGEDSDCSDIPHKTSCTEATEVCVGQPIACSADIPCTTAERPKCDTANKVCVPCGEDSDCSAIPDKTTCNQETGTCVEAPIARSAYIPFTKAERPKFDTFNKVVFHTRVRAH